MISERLTKVVASQTMKVSAEAKRLAGEGADIIDLSVGEPDFPTPDNVKAAAIAAINENFTKYTYNAGIVALREAISRKLKKDNSLDYSINEIVVSSGAKQSIFNAVNALVNNEDEVIIPSPYWVSYPEMVKLAHGTPVIVKTNEENDFKITPAQIEGALTERTKVLILCNPSNPTGTVYSKKELEAIAEVCTEIFIISDEIYEKLVYNGTQFSSFAALKGMKERTIIVNGVSKAYAMTGWRIGYSAGPEHFSKAIDKIQSHSTSNASSISQAAALEALNGPADYIEMMRNEYEKRRDYLYKELKTIKGVECRKPAGAFYIFPNIAAFFGKQTETLKITDSFDMAMYLLYQAGVAVVPGSAFGSDEHIRLSYSTSMENLDKAAERIKAALEKLS